jgi:ankyrin repeat protein
MNKQLNKQLNNDFLKAAKNGELETVTRLLDERPDININFKDDYGRSSLMEASSNGHFDIVKLLLDRGATIDDKDNAGFNSLMLASQRGHLAIVELLLDHGANINFTCNIRMTALMRASYVRHLATVKLLLDRGANIEAKDRYGDTSLHYACKSGQSNMPVIKLLLSYGADPNIKNNDGKKPIDVFGGTPEEKKQVEDLMKQHTITFGYEALGGLNGPHNPFGWHGSDTNLLTDLKEYLGGKKRKTIKKKTIKKKYKKSKKSKKR